MSRRGSALSLEREDFDIGAEADFGASGRYDEPTDVADRRRVRIARSHIRIRPSDFVTRFIKVKDSNTGTIIAIDFKERKYLERPYNTSAKRMLFMTSRQTEKCVGLNTLISLANGRLVEAQHIQIEDEVASMDEGGNIVSRKITWVSEHKRKTAYRITTRQRHVIEVAGTHPIRTWENWTPTSKLSKGDRIAVIRCGGEFGTQVVPSSRIRLTAYLIGDGDTSGSVIGFTAVPGPGLTEYIADVESLGGTYRRYTKEGTKAVSIRLRRLEPLRSWLEEDGLRCLSGDKQIPDWVFNLNKKDTALFINRLWSTDGHVSQRTRSNYNINYCSISKRLVEQVQALLWKFGIPSRIRENWPSIYKRRGEEKFAYILAVETKKGIEDFLTQVGALGKSENVPLPEEDSNNNLDTVPIEVQELITRIVESRDSTWRTELFSKGLARTLAYAPTWEKLQRYVEVFREDGQVDQALVDELESHLHTDIYWDRIRDIEKIGRMECVDFEVEGTHNFLAHGIITHNSTTLGNKLLQRSAMRRYGSALFVTPSAMQTTVFSRTRVADVIDISPLIKGMTSPHLTNNILEKEFISGSKIYLRYAFLTADRIRGLSVNDVFCDEIQDLLSQNMPVIEETASHTDNPFFCYSGTPKTYDNTIEHYWSKGSTQSEWVIPCEAHGTPKSPGTWHWNILGEKNLGLKGPICDKCGKALNPEHPMAQWVAMNPGADWEGFRICRLMVPWFAKNPDKWAEILSAHALYPRAQFFNEVLALSYDSGTKPITRTEVIRACDNAYKNTEEQAAEIAQAHPTYAGIDWGSGENTYTVLSVVCYPRNDTSMQVIYMKRFDGHLTDPDLQMEEIKRLLTLFRCRLMGTDYGQGFVQNHTLVTLFGNRRIHKFQYAARAGAKFGFSQKLRRYIVFRTPVMSDIFGALKRKKIRLPRWKAIEHPHGDDILAIFQEYSETQKMLRYDTAKGVPDDSLHSILYAALVSMLEIKRPDIINPDLEKKDRNTHTGTATLEALDGMF